MTGPVLSQPRIRVVIDITNPLKTGFVLRRGLLPCIWVDFKYERLCQFCYNCGRIGHVYRTCKFSTSSAKFGPSLRALTHFDSPYFGAKPRVLSRSRREICTELVVLPPAKSIVRQPMVEDKLYVLQHICPRMKPWHRSSSAPEVTMSYLWRKFALNSIDSTVMVMNSAIIFSNVSQAHVCERKWWLLMVIAGYLLYLALKVNREVRGLCFFKGYAVQDLTERIMVVFTEIFIFVFLFLMPFYGLKL